IYLECSRLKSLFPTSTCQILSSNLSLIGSTLGVRVLFPPQKIALLQHSSQLPAPNSRHPHPDSPPQLQTSSPRNLTMWTQNSQISHIVRQNRALLRHSVWSWGGRARAQSRGGRAQSRGGGVQSWGKESG